MGSSVQDVNTTAWMIQKGYSPILLIDISFL